MKNADLPQKLRCNTKSAHVKEHKKSFGTSIKEGPESIGSREEFGHWEIDTVIG